MEVCSSKREKKGLMKRHICLIILTLLFFDLPVNSQDTTYYNSFSEKVNNNSVYERYIVESIAGSTNLLEHYNENGILVKRERRSIFFKNKSHGKEEHFYPDGNLKLVLNYVRGKLEGQVLSFWPGGTIKRKDVFSQDELVTGNCYNEKGEKVSHFPVYIKPKYPGGIDQLIQDIEGKLIYPIEARKLGIEGMVYVQFVINKNGKLNQLKIGKSAHALLNNSAIEVVQQLKPFVPGQLDGDPIKVLYTLPINFILD